MGEVVSIAPACRKSAQQLMAQRLKQTSEYCLAVQLALHEVRAPGAAVQAVATLGEIVDDMATDRNGLCDRIWSTLDRVVLDWRLSGALVEAFKSLPTTAPGGGLAA